MRDFPFFSTEYGVASITLREIPYTRQGYIWVQTVQKGSLLCHLKECAQFCRAAGAERVFAANHPGLKQFKSYFTLLRMEGENKAAALEPEVFLVPVGAENVGQWREWYNQKMAMVDGASALTFGDESRILSLGGGWFIHRRDTLIGLGWLAGKTIHAVASLVPGEGRTVLRHLMATAALGQRLSLEVASTNERAIRLYRDFGFSVTEELVTWYELPDSFA